MLDIPFAQSISHWSLWAPGGQGLCFIYLCIPSTLLYYSAVRLEMATHFSSLAWEIPRTEEPGGLESMGLQRVGHNWVTEHSSKKLINSLCINMHDLPNYHSGSTIAETFSFNLFPTLLLISFYCVNQRSHTLSDNGGLLEKNSLQRGRLVLLSVLRVAPFTI